MRIVRRRHVRDLFVVLSMAGASHMTDVSLGIGLSLFAAGLGVHVWTKGVLRRNAVLCKDGPYALCRHPFYLANALGDIGLCVMSGYMGLLVLYVLVFAVAYAPSIRSEEIRLRESFGEAHAEFCRTTPMLLPLGFGFLRDWRSPLSRQRLLRDHVLSRLIRQSGYPLLVILAARVWRAPANLGSAGNLILTAGFLATVVFSRVTYAAVERGKRGGVLSRGALALARHGFFVCALAFPAFTLARCPDTDDLLLAGTFSALLWGWWLLLSSLSRGLNGRRWPARVLLYVPAGAIVLLGATVQQTGWWLPLGLSLVAGHLVLPAGARRDRARFAVRLAGGGTLSVMAFIVLALNTGLIWCDPALITAALKAETRDRDLVLVLENHHIENCVGKLPVDGAVSAGELQRLARLRGRKAEFFLVAEDDDMARVPLRLRNEFDIRRVVKIGLKTYQILRHRHVAH